MQTLSNLAYDKLARYLDELESKKMITKEPLVVIERGHDFLQDYNRIRDFISEMSVKYLDVQRREFL